MNSALFRISSIALMLSSLVVVALVLVSRVFADDPVAGGKFEVGLWGDLPYARAGTGPATSKVPNLIQNMNEANLAFTVFDGDTKDGSSVCSDDVIGTQVRNRFNTVAAPTVYVVGDNEWTDCHRSNNGDYDALERLSYIRRTLFSTAESFGQRKMVLEHQGPLSGPYSENTRWVYNNVVFVGLNIIGSNNNKVAEGQCTASNTKRTQTHCDAANVEYLQRDAMNLAWLRRSFDMAKQIGAPGIMVVIQADPGFDTPDTTANERENAALDGFNNFIQTLTQETQAFKGQVVLVHGDSHYFRVDMPLFDPLKLLPNFTRVETFGEGNAHWVRATVDPNSKKVFTFEPMIVPGN